MEITSVGIDPQQLGRKAVLVAEDKRKLKGTHVLDYIKWGEKQGFHERPTVQARANENRNWYDITDAIRRQIILPKLQQYRHIVSINPKLYLCSSSLLTADAPDHLINITCAVLNSTIVALIKQFFGRIHGREGSLQLDVYAARMMPIPDPNGATTIVRKRLEAALDSMRVRQALPLIDVDSTSIGWTGELALTDRQQLDDAVLELLGISDKKERENLRAELYEEVTKLYRSIRVAEREMQRHRSANARQGRATAQSIAAEIWDSLDTPPDYRTPLDFIPPRARTETFDLPAEGRARVIPGNMFQPDSVKIGDTIIDLGNPARCEFVKQLSYIGINGSVSVPTHPEHCSNALRDHQAYADETNAEFQRLAAAYTSEEPMQERVVKELWRKLKA
jgi:hypothetical protein